MAYDAAQPDHDAPATWAATAHALDRADRSAAAGPTSAAATPLLIDCDTCQVRGIGCADCVVTVLLGGPPDGVSLNDEERQAVEVLAAAGLVPPLRLVSALASEVVETA